MIEQQTFIRRPARPEDAPQLKALWHTVFGDEAEGLDLFFDTWFTPELTAVIDEGGTPVAAAYALPVGQLVLPCDGGPFPCAMLYGIATHPDRRGLGFGAAVSNAAHKLATQNGYPAVVLKPANDSLFHFYEKHTAFREFFTATTTEWTPADLPAPDHVMLTHATPEEYRQCRRRVLEGSAFIDLDVPAIAYQDALCRHAGGGLYSLSYRDKEAGCAVIETEGGTVNIKELLLSRNCPPDNAVAAVAALFPADWYTVRSNSAGSTINTKKHRFAMLAALPIPAADLSVQTAKWYGLAFD